MAQYMRGKTYAKQCSVGFLMREGILFTMISHFHCFERQERNVQYGEWAKSAAQSDVYVQMGEHLLMFSDAPF